MSDDNLGKLTGDVLAHLGSVDAFLEDPITRSYGVGWEMVGDVSSAVATTVTALLASHGYTVDTFLAAVTERVGDRWVYLYGLDALTVMVAA